MDAIDQKQQDEIEALKRTDAKHDTLFNRVYVFFFLTVLAIFIAGFIALPFLSLKMNPTINIVIDQEVIKKLK
jgi:hypothetical protein